jgi:hemerythrin-like metal-binding protein
MNLKTNFSEIDRDHDVIIELLKKTNVKDFPERDVKESFHYLFELYYECQDHFKREEMLMTASLYPEKERHVSSHNDCIAKFDLYLNLIQNIDPDESKLYILEGVSDMLHDWIIPHIHFEDKLLAAHLLLSQKSIWFCVKERIKNFFS